MESTEKSAKLKIEENVALRDLSTIRIGGTAKYFARIATAEQLVEAYAWAKSHKLPVIILGGGSNVIFEDKDYNCLMIKLEIKDFEVVKSKPKNVWVRVGAGEIWDEVVARAVQMGLSGIEGLSLIPGSAGATPVQNVGAYGQEIKDVLESVEAFDAKTGQVVTLSNEECNFRYRDSLFKSDQPGRYVICYITLKLSTGKPAAPTYQSLKHYFATRGIDEPTLQQIRDGVITIRLTKLPDPTKLPNVGSFFKNPIIDKVTFLKLQAKYPDIVYHDTKDGKYKIYAGWLIERTGLKGKRYQNIEISPNNALVLINHGPSSYQDLLGMKEIITQAVYEKFGLELVQEPLVLS